MVVGGLITSELAEFTMRRLVIWAASVSLLATSAHARVLDDFSDGSIRLVTSPAPASPTSDESSGLDPAHTIGGARHITIHDQVILQINYPNQTSIAPPGQAVFMQGIAGNSSYGEFSYGRTLPLSADLTQDGSRQFQVTLSGHQRTAYLSRAKLTVDWLNGSGTAISESRPFGRISHQGDLATGYIPFSEFGDLTNVSQIVLRFNNSGLFFNGAPTFAVHNFVTAVPEAGAFALITTAGVGLIWLSKHKGRIRDCRVAGRNVSVSEGLRSLLVPLSARESTC